VAENWDLIFGEGWVCCCLVASPEGYENPAGPTTRQVTIQLSSPLEFPQILLSPAGSSPVHTNPTPSVISPAGDKERRCEKAIRRCPGHMCQGVEVFCDEGTAVYVAEQRCVEDTKECCDACQREEEVRRAGGQVSC
jgi:hypothetical protein